jgi:hypothetical protein
MAFCCCCCCCCCFDGCSRCFLVVIHTQEVSSTFKYDFIDLLIPYIFIGFMKYIVNQCYRTCICIRVCCKV